MLRQTKGAALTVTDEEMLERERNCVARRNIRRSGRCGNRKCNKKARCVRLDQAERTVVLFNTGTGYKYAEAWQRALAVRARGVAAVATRRLITTTPF